MKLTMYGEPYKLDNEDWENIVSYMNDEIREDVHMDMAPCKPMEFLQEYLKRDEDFEYLMYEVFNIEIDYE